MKVATLALNFQMRLHHAPRQLVTATTALCASTQAALLAAQGRLTRPKEVRILNCIAIAIGKKDLQADINTDAREVISRVRHIAGCRQFAYGVASLAQL